MNIFKISFLSCFLILGLVVRSRAQQQISLDGEWRFSLDFTDTGLRRGWEKETYKSEGSWDRVKVPHSYSADGRYLFYEGAAWYRKQFVFDNERGNSRLLLRFDGVFNRSEIWLNGNKIGNHEGGYTAFEFDVTQHIRVGKNTLVVKVNNKLDSLTVPTILDVSSNAGNVGWVNYGGITRNVSLSVQPEVYLKNVKVEAIPDLSRGNSTIKIKTFVVNTKNIDTVVNLAVRLYKDGQIVPNKMPSTTIRIAKNSSATFLSTIKLDSKNTSLWSVDDPKLYQADLALGNHRKQINFGIRKIEIIDGKLLVNGESVKYGGGNLVLDYPKFGSVVNDSIVEKYMGLMKRGGMEFQRLTHYPLPEKILDWADKNGMLIITEAGNWGYGDIEMNNPNLRSIFKRQLQEMIEANWNHPSVIAYSVGNEFDSHRKSGIDWTRDMFSFIKTIDTTRLNTLVSNKLDRREVVKAEDEASLLADFVCANIYSNTKGFEQTVHKIERMYPDKPIFISEWGIRADHVKNEKERVDYVKDIMNILRKSNKVIGSSWWSFNDYYSRYSGSNRDGFRPWGLVDYSFSPREAYWTHQEELSPAVIRVKKFVGNTLTIELSVRNDFPSYSLKGYKLHFDGEYIVIPMLLPGQKKELNLILKEGQKVVNISLLKPTGFEVYNKNLTLN